MRAPTVMLPILLVFVTQPLAASAQRPGAGQEIVSRWVGQRFSDEEMAALPRSAFGTESWFCGCSDRPTPHYPYALVVFTTPRGDLVARAEGHEGEMRITPVAVRTGERYCDADDESVCFGSFRHPCDFTDHRFGPALSPYFPTCKDDAR